MGDTNGRGGGPSLRARAMRDLLAVLAVVVGAFLLASAMDAFEAFADWSRRHEGWQADEIAVALPLTAAAVAVFALRRWLDVRRAWRDLSRDQGRFEELLEHLPDVAVQGYAPDGTVHYWNRANEAVYGYTAEEAIGKDLVEIIIPPEMRPMVRQIIAHGARTGEMPGPAEYSLLRKDGTRVPVFSSHAVLRQEGREPELFCIDIDLRPLKRVEDQLRASLREKEVLLREVHHRVKNNLQFISSLLNLQADHVQGGALRAVFRECQARIKTMSLIHERLYRGDDLSKVDFAAYFEALARDVFRSFGADPQRIELAMRIEPVGLGIDEATPCGLILHELVSNSLKHAFPADRSGRIAVELRRQDDGQVLLAVRDDGVGFAALPEVGQAESLGLQLAGAMVRQLGGTLRARTDGGAHVEIRFPRERAASGEDAA